MEYCRRMTNPTPEDLAAFEAVWKHDFGEELTDDEARHHAQKLLTLYAALAKEMPREK